MLKCVPEADVILTVGPHCPENSLDSRDPKIPQDLRAFRTPQIITNKNDLLWWATHQNQSQRINKMSLIWNSFWRKKIKSTTTAQTKNYYNTNPSLSSSDDQLVNILSLNWL